MPLTREQRLEYLQRAREAKKAKAEEAKTLEEVIPQATVKKEKKAKSVKKTLDLDLTKEIQMDAKREEEEKLINEVIKVKAPAKKRIIKRVIEVEEPSTDEEVQEEVVIKPRARRSSTSQSTVKKEMIQDEATQIPKQNNNLYRDIFPD